MTVPLRALVALALSSFVFAGAVDAVNPTPTLTTSAAIHREVLRNGLTVLVKEDHSAPVVSAQAWVRAGSVTEDRWLGAGLSHVLEHMLFKGTTTRGIAQIAQEVEDKGGYINAYTSFDHTVYHIDLPSENWRTAVDILADCMMHATIPEAELLKEKQVILREMAMNEDDPERRADRRLWSTAYTTHPYRLPVIGYPDIYNRVSHADVLAYYKQHYVPNNMVFVVVGNVTAADVVAALRDLTKDFKMAPVAPACVPAEPPQLALRRFDETMPVQMSEVRLAWHIPALTSPDIYPLDALAIILGQGDSSRLHQSLVEKRGLAHRVEAYSYTPKNPGLFGIEVTADPDRREAALAGARAEVARLLNRGVTDAEVQKAIKLSTSHLLARLKTMAGQASDIGGNELLLSDPEFSDKYLANLGKVTAADINRAAAKYLQDDNLTVTTLSPPAAATVAATTAVATNQIQIKKFVLPNGLRLLVREDAKLPFVTLRALFKGGVFAETPANNGITKLTARLLLKGTARRTAGDIARNLESVGGSISYFAGNNSFGVNAEVLRDDFNLGLDILADVLQNATFPAEPLTREREIQLAEIKEDQDRIMRQAQQLLRETLFQQHPYRLNPLGRPESVNKLHRADLERFRREYIVPDNMVLCVFGNVRADEVQRQVATAFGRQKPGHPKFTSTGAEQLAATVRREATAPKEQAVLLLGYSGADLFSPDRYALELLDNAYSGQGSRIFLRIRDELGLAYYVGAYELLGLEPGYFALYVGTTAPKVATCEQELLAELRQLATEGLAPAELERARNNVIGQQKVQLQDNNELSLIVGLDELYGLGYDRFLSAEQQYRRVTVDDIKRVAAKYFGDRPHATVVVMPAAK